MKEKLLLRGGYKRRIKRESRRRFSTTHSHLAISGGWARLRSARNKHTSERESNKGSSNVHLDNETYLTINVVSGRPPKGPFHITLRSIF